MVLTIPSKSLAVPFVFSAKNNKTFSSTLSLIISNFFRRIASLSTKARVEIWTIRPPVKRERSDSFKLFISDIGICEAAIIGLPDSSKVLKIWSNSCCEAVLPSMFCRSSIISISALRNFADISSMGSELLSFLCCIFFTNSSENSRAVEQMTFE